MCTFTITSGRNGDSNVRAAFGTRVTNRNEWYIQGEPDFKKILFLAKYFDSMGGRSSYYSIYSPHTFL